MADRQDDPPVALGRLDESDGWLDWTLTACVVVLAIPVVVVFGPIVWIIRAYDRVAGKAVAHAE